MDADDARPICLSNLGRGLCLAVEIFHLIYDDDDDNDVIVTDIECIQIKQYCREDCEALCQTRGASGGVCLHRTCKCLSIVDS